ETQGWLMKPYQGKLLAAIDPADDDVLMIWDWGMPKNPKRIKMNRNLDFRETDCCCVAFTPDGKIMATAGTRVPLKMWDLATGRLIRTFSESRELFTCLAFSPDAQSIAASNENGEIRLWDAASGKLRFRYEASWAGINEILFSLGGELL